MVRAIRRSLVVALVLTTALTAVPASTPPAAAWTRPQARIGGANRYETAARISAALYRATPNEAVVIASGESFPDSLAAGPLAALKNGPLLLTGRTHLPAVTRDELVRLRPRRVFVVGGPSAISTPIFHEIGAATGVFPKRLAGPSRYATSGVVADQFPTGDGGMFVASGDDFPDALTAASAAASREQPLILTPSGRLADATRWHVAKRDHGEVVIVGGPFAVSHAVASEIAAAGARITRLAGDDRYATAAAVAAHSAPNPSTVLIATGHTFADALAAAPLAASLQAPLLLTSSCVPPHTVDYLRDRGWPDEFVLGGAAAVPERGTTLPCFPVPDGRLSDRAVLTTHVRSGTLLRVLNVDGVPMRVVTASGRLTGRLRTTEIARGHRARVAINGTFFRSDGEPTYGMAIGGRVLKAPGGGGTLLSFSTQDPRRSLFASPDFRIRFGDVGITRVNSGAPGAGEAGLFTTEDGRPTNVGAPYCRAGIVPTAAPTVADGDNVQRFRVRSVACSTSTLLADDTDIVAALVGTPAALAIQDLPVGEEVELRWRSHPQAEAMTDVVGGNMTLVHRRQVATDVTMNDGPFLRERAPRTAICALPGGQFAVVVADGRQPGYSTGLTPAQLAGFLIEIGCDDALNLDGGGSTALAVDGFLANRPSDPGGQRSVGSAVLLVV